MFSRAAEIRKAADVIRAILLRENADGEIPLVGVAEEALDEMQQKLSDLAAKQEMFEMLNCKV